MRTHTFKRHLQIVACAVAAFAITSYGGTLTVKFGSAMEVIEGGVTNTYAKNATFTPTAIPCIYMMRPANMAEGERTFAVFGTDKVGDYNYMRIPQYGEGNWVRVALDPYPSADTTVTLTGYTTSNFYYADAEHGNDDWDGTADYENRDESISKGPKKSLQAAHDAATGSYPIVFVAPGVYSNGVTTTYTDSGHLLDGSSGPCKRRLVITKQIGFLATGGADETFIVGAPDPETGGVGANAVGGVYTSPGSSSYCFMQGFTFTGCYSIENQTTTLHYGVAFCSGGYRSYVLDCMISNNVAKYYPATSWSVVKRTKIFENKSTQWIVRYGNFISSVFARNQISYGNGYNNNNAICNGTANYYFCTINLKNDLQPNGRQRLHNTQDNLILGCLVYGLTSDGITSEKMWRNSLIIGEPFFGDVSRNDYRLGALSPALNVNSYETGLTNIARRVMTSGVDGEMPVLHDGKMRVGAVWNDPPLPMTVLNTADGGMSVSGASAGTNVVLSASEVTVTAAKAASRPFVGFEVNGERLPYAGVSYSFTPSTVAGSVTTVKAIYDTEWYIDCVNGDDANSGTAALPKQTIRAATTNAISGDVIHVAPGTYAEAEGTQTVGSTGASRVVVPANVTLESTGGADVTYIVGAEATGDQIDNETYKTGTNGVRCVYANSGAVVRGFTLIGGRGNGVEESIGRGAAFYSGTARAATVEECLVTNNAACRGAIYQALVKRCRVMGNIGTRKNDNGEVCMGRASSAGYACSWYGSIIDGNLGGATVDGAYAFENCTIGTGNWTPTDSPQVLYWWSTADKAIVNSAVLGGRYYLGGGGKLYCTNCLVMADQVATNLKREQSYNTIFTNAAAAQVDSEYRPILGKFLGIDKGDASFASAEVGDIDFYGTPRILNGSIDIGAVEYDWRPAFAEALGKRFTVTYASPSVTTNTTGGLLVPDGAVAGTVTSADPYLITFAMSGGTMAVYVGGVLAGECSGSGEQSIRFTVADAADEVRFVYTPEAENPGSVVLKKLSGARGFVLTIL